MKKSPIIVGIFSLVVLFMIPTLQASATNTSENAWHYYNQRVHITDRLNHAKICGDHYCTSGEYMTWTQTMSAAQRSSFGKTSEGMHGENVINSMTGSPQGSPMHGQGRMGYTNSTNP